MRVSGVRVMSGLGRVCRRKAFEPRFRIGHADQSPFPDFRGPKSARCDLLECFGASDSCPLAELVDAEGAALVQGTVS